MRVPPILSFCLMVPVCGGWLLLASPDAAAAEEGAIADFRKALALQPNLQSARESLHALGAKL